MVCLMECCNSTRHRYHYLVTLADNADVVKEPLDPQEGDQENDDDSDGDDDDSYANEVDDSPLADNDGSDDGEVDDEAHKLDHSEVSAEKHTSSNGDAEGDEEKRKETQKDSDDKEGTIEVVFDGGGVKITKKINIMPGMELIVNEKELEDHVNQEEEEDDEENTDTEIEQEESIKPEEGDGK